MSSEKIKMSNIYKKKLKIKYLLSAVEMNHYMSTHYMYLSGSNFMGCFHSLLSWWIPQTLNRRVVLFGISYPENKTTMLHMFSLLGHTAHRT